MKTYQWQYKKIEHQQQKDKVKQDIIRLYRATQSFIQRGGDIRTRKGCIGLKE